MTQSTEPAEPGRGVLILVLGILSLVVCAPLGPVAWVMGRNDLNKIQRGRLSEENKGLTQAGMICGIVATILLILSLLALIFMVLLGGMASQF